MQITYKPIEIQHPEYLISSLALQLSRCFIEMTTPTSELETDIYINHKIELIAVFMGFGIFMINSSFHFSQFTDSQMQGWRASASFNLSQYELTYSLAIFCELKKVSADVALPFIKKNMRSYYKKCVQEIKTKTEEIDTLKKIVNPMKSDCSN